MVEPERSHSVCFAGGGLMARGMIGRLQAAGFRLRLFNRTVEHLAGLVRDVDEICDTPSHAARGAQFIISSLADDEASRSVWFGRHGLLAGAESGAVGIETSTVSSSYIEEWALAIASRGVRAVECPVTGSREGARTGTLCSFLGGAPEAIACAEPVISVISDRQFFFGPSGSAMRFKLVYNLIGAGIGAILAEGLALAQEMGLQPEITLSAICGESWGKEAARSKGMAMVARNHSDVHYTMGLCLKDISYALEEAARLGLQLPCARAVADRYRAAVGQGWGNSDISSIRETVV